MVKGAVLCVLAVALLAATASARELKQWGAPPPPPRLVSACGSARRAMPSAVGWPAGAAPPRRRAGRLIQVEIDARQSPGLRRICAGVQEAGATTAAATTTTITTAAAAGAAAGAVAAGTTSLATATVSPSDLDGLPPRARQGNKLPVGWPFPGVCHRCLKLSCGVSAETQASVLRKTSPDCLLSRGGPMLVSLFYIAWSLIQHGLHSLDIVKAASYTLFRLAQAAAAAPTTTITTMATAATAL